MTNTQLARALVNRICQVTIDEFNAKREAVSITADDLRDSIIYVTSSALKGEVVSPDAPGRVLHQAAVNREPWLMELLLAKEDELIYNSDVN